MPIIADDEDAAEHTSISLPRGMFPIDISLGHPQGKPDIDVRLGSGGEEAVPSNGAGCQARWCPRNRQERADW